MIIQNQNDRFLYLRFLVQTPSFLLKACRRVCEAELFDLRDTVKGAMRQKRAQVAFKWPVKTMTSCMCI